MQFEKETRRILARAYRLEFSILLLLHMEENQGIRIRHLMTHASDSTNALFRVERLARAPMRFKVGFSSVLVNVCYLHSRRAFFIISWQEEKEKAQQHMTVTHE